MPPRREGSRPLLPQHARHCPVLEAGSALGFMVYASLEPKESVYVEFEGDGRFRFVYYLQTQDGKRAPIFHVALSLSVGAVGSSAAGSGVRDLATRSRTPLTKRADSAEPNRAASSFASWMTTSRGCPAGS